MNEIIVKEPRWSTGDVLIADWKVQQHNLIVIQHKDFDHPFYLSQAEALKYPVMDMPTKKGGTVKVRQIPLADLEKEKIDV